jgi:hypothetical protein
MGRSLCFYLGKRRDSDSNLLDATPGEDLLEGRGPCDLVYEERLRQAVFFEARSEDEVFLFPINRATSKSPESQSSDWYAEAREGRA